MNKKRANPSLSEKVFWVGRMIEIQVDTTKIKVMALCLGPICVHKMLVGNHWAVTSVTTGLRATRAMTESEAKKIAEILYKDQKVRAAFSKTKMEQVIGFMPEWVRPWLLECNKSLVCTNPYGHMQRAMKEEDSNAEDEQEQEQEAGVEASPSTKSVATPQAAVGQRMFKSAVRKR